MNEIDEVLEAVNYFTKENKSFTSVHISNYIKRKGIWIKNSVVSDLIARFFEQGKLDGYSYKYENIKRTEDGLTVKAKKYYDLNNEEEIEEIKCISKDFFDDILYSKKSEALPKETKTEFSINKENKLNTRDYKKLLFAKDIR